MAEKKSAPVVTGLLQTRSFKALFRASLVPERVPFEVDGRPCWVDLLPLGDEEMDEYMQSAFDYEINAATGVPVLKKVRIAEQKRFLITRSLVGWELAVYHPKTDSWTVEVASENPRDRQRKVEEMDFTGEFGNWLFFECQRVNGLLEEQEKN